MTNFAHDESNTSDIYQYGTGEVYADLGSLQAGVRTELSDNTIVLIDGLPTDLAAASARAKRDKILVESVDPVVSNPLRWADMSSEKQNQWTQYRTFLLEVPQQSDFPASISWPTKP